MPVNGAHLVTDELPLWQVGPQIQQQGEPLGGLLALLGGLYEPNVRAIAVRNGLASYASILDDAFAYIPADITVPGFLEAGDIADVEASLAPKPVLLENMIDAKNRLVSPTDLRQQLDPLYRAYREVPANLTIQGSKPLSIAEWLVAHL
jgi:hypothetical protein